MWYMHPQLRVQLPGLPYSAYNMQAHSPCPTSRVCKKGKQYPFQREWLFAQMPNVADVGSIREQVQGRVSDLLAAVERSINSANLLQLEKSLNSAYSLFLATEENGTTPKSLSPTTNAPSNKIMEKQPRFFSTKRKHNRVRSVRFVRPSRQEKEDIMENYKEKRKFANLLRVIAILKIE